MSNSNSSDTWIGWVIVIAVIAFMSEGVDGVKTFFGDTPPQLLEIDGQSAIACKGATVRSDGGLLAGDTFRVEYTDTDGLKHTLRGARKVRLDDVPKTVKSTLPANPSLGDKDGKDYVVGEVYTWANGDKGRFVFYDDLYGNDGKPILNADKKAIHMTAHFAALDEPNPVCADVRKNPR
jgi:hypothetical protein